MLGVLGTRREKGIPEFQVETERIYAAGENNKHAKRRDGLSRRNGFEQNSSGFDERRGILEAHTACVATKSGTTAYVPKTGPALVPGIWPRSRDRLSKLKICDVPLNLTAP